MLTEKIKSTIDELMQIDVHGCITGSSMIPDVNFDYWDEVPDIDLFVYYEEQLLWAAAVLTLVHGFKPLSDGEEWKFERVKTMGIQKNAPLSTLKFERDGVIVNVTYKKGKTNMFSVLSSFDMSIIMIGVDIQTGVMLDLREAWPGMVIDDPKEIWSPDVKVAYPNPLRKQDVDMYGAEMWVRQFNRVIKYWNRGFDTRPMAQFYIRLIDGVIEKGQLFRSEKSEAEYNRFVDTYVPLRESMVEWLNDKEGTL